MLDGINCVILEWSEEVRLGMTKAESARSRVAGRTSRSLVRGRTKEEWLFNEGAMLPDCDCVAVRWRVGGRAAGSHAG